MFCTRLKKIKCKLHGSLDFYYRKLYNKYSEQLYITWTFQNDQRTYSVSSDCSRGLFLFFNGTHSSSEIVCRSLIYKMSKRASSVELNVGCVCFGPTSSGHALPLPVVFSQLPWWNFWAQAALTTALYGLLFLAASGVDFFPLCSEHLVPNL